MLRSLIAVPLEEAVTACWNAVEPASKKAFLAALVVSVLAFGFQMTNLTLHHDDVLQIFNQTTGVGHGTGRFGLGWLHYFTQNHYFMPFLQMLEGIVMMSAYGVLVARFWGARKAADIALMAAIMCVFPYMAQVYQYNTAMATYSAAHLLVVLAVMLSVRARVVSVAVAALLYMASLSIYQSVAANAATLFVLWLLSRHLFGGNRNKLVSRGTAMATIAAAVAAITGGALYLGAVSMMHIDFDAYQSAGDAFKLHDAMNVPYAVPAMVEGTRNFFFWPEHYYPEYLKKIHLALLGAATLLCVWVPERLTAKVTAVALLVVASLSPRVLQLLHPEGNYHNLTLTAYALVIAGAVMIVNRAGPVIVRNASMVLTGLLVAGYVIQCNWISTVNHLNTVAHFTMTSEVLARVRSIPDARWDGKKIVVVGRYDMPSDYPFRPATGVATQFMDAPHMEAMARLLRDEATFVAADATMPKVLEYALAHRPWPDPGSVGIVDGMGVVVFSNRPPAIH